MSVNTEFVVSVHITEIVLRMQKVFCFENGTLNVKGKPEDLLGAGGGQSCPQQLPGPPHSSCQLGMGQRVLWAPPALPAPPCGYGRWEWGWWPGAALGAAASWGVTGRKIRKAGWVFPAFLGDCALSWQSWAGFWRYPTPCSSWL